MDGDLKEQALANFDHLLNYWGLEYTKISATEYDIIAKWRDDQDFGGCRFNTYKAVGADFAGAGITIKQMNDELEAFGLPLDSSDIMGFRIGFDIIGLCQRVHQLATPKQGAEQLIKDLAEIAKMKELNHPIMGSAQRRQEAMERYEKQNKQLALDIWNSARFHRWKGSVAEKYLKSRGIKVQSENMRFHPRVSKGDREFHPALLFKVQKFPDGPLEAIHRIFLTEDGKKIKDNPKMALAKIGGNAIWFGKNHPVLHLAEGPESALYLRELGHAFVASCVFATNMHNLTLPSYVGKLVLVGDQDRAGAEAVDRALKSYAGKVDIELFPIFEGKDINDTYKG